jgi:hypothetical protein
MIASGRNENLCFMFQSAESFGVKNAIAVALPFGAQGIFGKRHFPAFGFSGFRSARIEKLFLTRFQHGADVFAHVVSLAEEKRESTFVA